MNVYSMVLSWRNYFGFVFLLYNVLGSNDVGQGDLVACPAEMKQVQELDAVQRASFYQAEKWRGV